MLGHLARWLRVLGYDTAYEPDIEDEVLVRRAIEEHRTILTCDRRLTEEWRVGGVLVFETRDAADLLRETAERLRIAWPRELFTRCLECNSALVDAPAEEVRSSVPDRVASRHDRFQRCPNCGKIYWPGSHTERMRTWLERVFDQTG